MEIRPHRIINRKTTKEIKVGKVSVGGKSPISVQSMTNTLTTDIKGTINQILSLEGKLINTGTINSNLKEIDISKLSNGSYLIKIGNSTKPFIVSK